MSSNQPSNHPSRRALVLSTGEAASFLGISEEQFRDLAKTGRVAISEGPTGEMLVEVVLERSEFSLGLTARSVFVPFLEGANSAESLDASNDLWRAGHPETRARAEPHGLDASVLASALTARLASVAPEEADVSSEGPIVKLAGSWVDIRQSLEEFGSTDEERLEIAARNVLNAASDSFAEKTGDPWPAKAGQIPGGFPEVHVETRGGCLRMFYGDPARPMLELDPITVADILTRDL